MLSLAFFAVIATGCTTSQQTITYKTLFSIEHVTVSAYDGYLDTVIKGQTSTNSLPLISRAYNTFQGSYLIALDVAQYNTNALAPAALITESQDIINLINTVKGK